MADEAHAVGKPGRFPVNVSALWGGPSLETVFWYEADESARRMHLDSLQRATIDQRVCGSGRKVRRGCLPVY